MSRPGFDPQIPNRASFIDGINNQSPISQFFELETFHMISFVYTGIAIVLFNGNFRIRA